MADIEMADAIHSPVENGHADNSATNGESKRLPVTVTKPIPYTFDLGNLACYDANPLPNSPDNAELQATARDCAQSLLNQLLSTCEIQSLPEGVHISLPAPSTPLPREKSVPKAKEPTKWEKFAAKKGILPKKRGEGNKVYDEESGDWVAKWGYKGANKKGENEWLVEVDEKKEAKTGEAEDVRKERRQERVDRMKRQARREKANAARAVVKR